MGTVTFDPEIPLALWLPLTVLAVGLAVAYAVHSRERLVGPRWLGIVALMSVSVAIPLVLLLNPTWVRPIPPPAGKPELAILVDGTGSMSVSDCGDGASRYAAALRIANEMVETLSDQYETRIWSLAEDTTPTDLSRLAQQRPEAMFTDLAGAVQQALLDRPQGQALLLLSDGVHNTAGGADRVAPQRRDGARHVGACLRAAAGDRDRCG